MIQANQSKLKEKFMNNDQENTPDNEEGEAKPTITIAEKQGGAAADDAKPTITIAERESDDDGDD